MPRLATKVVVAAILAFTAITASGCVPAATAPDAGPPLGVAAG